MELSSSIPQSEIHNPQFLGPTEQPPLHLIPVAAVRGAAGTPHRPHQREGNGEEDQVGRQHREERRHDQPVPQFFAADQPDVVNREHREARADDQADATARKPHRERHAEQREDHAGGRDRELFLNLDLVDGGALPRGPKPLLVGRNGRRRGLLGGEGSTGGGRRPRRRAAHGCLRVRAVRKQEPLDGRGEAAVRAHALRACRGGDERGRGRGRALHAAAQLGPHRVLRLLLHPLHVLPGAGDHVLHGADRHFAVAPIVVVLGLLECVPDTGYLDPVDDEKRAIELVRRGAFHFVPLAVAQRQVQVGAAGGKSHSTRIGADDPAPLGVLQVENRHLIQRVGGVVDPGGAQEELARHDLVDHLFFQLKRRLLPLDVDEERPQLVIGARQDLVIPDERDQRHEQRPTDHGAQQLADADPARAHCRDLVVGGEVAERVQHGHQHGHRQRHRDDEGNRERERLEDHRPRQPLADEVAELFGDLIDEHRECERRERVAERRDVLPQDVTAEDAHGWSRHYIRNPKSLQGMRRLAQLVGLVVSLVVPRVHAQAPASTFGVPPLVPPRNAALLPGGRLGARVPPALVARAWVQAVQARRLPLWAEVAPAMAAAPATPIPPPPPPVTFEGVTPGRAVLGYADIGMQLNLRFELKADQFRNLSCTSQERLLALSGCSGGFPTITPNPQYSIRTAGVVGQRLHLDVDFDSEREFDANNNLHVWYEGLEDEILRRVEAGNVTFQAPPSRFIPAAVPANNFGVQAIAQLGAVEFRGILAQQKGNVVKDRFYSVGDVTRQPIDREARDLDYEPGRFFFVIAPAALPGYPAIDILELDQTARPDSLTVGALRVFRRRAIAPGSPRNQNVGGGRAGGCGAGGA